MQIENLANEIAFNGMVGLKLYGKYIEFDMSQPHEKKYLLRELFGVPYPQADIDRKLFQAFIEDGDTCLDLGANIGVTALEMLGAGAKKVIAFEPVEPLYARLNLLSDMALEVHRLAVGADMGSGEIVHSSLHNQGHSLSRELIADSPKVFGENPVVEHVNVISLDGFFDEGAGEIWKVDVEGLEFDVLVGAKRLLETAPPRCIFVECYDAVERLAEVLGSDWTGYRVGIDLSDDKICLGPISWVPQVGKYAVIAPTYLFLRPDAQTIPESIAVLGDVEAG